MVALTILTEALDETRKDGNRERAFVESAHEILSVGWMRPLTGAGVTCRGS
jgi:hypothetical protein